MCRLVVPSRQVPSADRTRIANQWTLHAVASDHRRVDEEQRDARVQATPIRHVLFDADGVLQDVPGGYQAAAEPYLGERAMEFLHRAWDDELPALAGSASCCRWSLRRWRTSG